MKRELKTTLSLVHPDIGESVDNKRQGQKYCHDRTDALPDIAVNDPVYVLNHGLGAKWLPGADSPIGCQERIARLAARSG